MIHPHPQPRDENGFGFDTVGVGVAVAVVEEVVDDGVGVLVDGVGVEDSVGFVFDHGAEEGEGGGVVVEEGVVGGVVSGVCSEGFEGYFSVLSVTQFIPIQSICHTVSLIHLNHIIHYRSFGSHIRFRLPAVGCWSGKEEEG